MRSRYPEHEILSDIGSGINFKRKNLIALLEQTMLGNVREVVVAHRDRLCRFGFELLEWFFAKHNVKLVVLDQTSGSPQSELVADLLSIITVFSCRVHGLRKYSDKIKEDKVLSEQGSEKNSV
jgi:predicted site-specific integrase-resolvase